MPSALPVSFLLFLTLVGGRPQESLLVEVEGMSVCTSEGKELGLKARVLG